MASCRMMRQPCAQLRSSCAPSASRGACPGAARLTTAHSIPSRAALCARPRHRCSAYAAQDVKGQSSAVSVATPSSHDTSTTTSEGGAHNAASRASAVGGSGNTDMVASLELAAAPEPDADLEYLLGMSKYWFFLVGAANVCLVPYLMLYFKTELHFSEADVGLVSAMRPWLSSAAMFAGTVIADTYNIHRQMLIGALAAATLMRSAVFISGGGMSAAVLAIAAEVIYAPVIPFVDTMAIQVAEQTGTSYGEQRMWTSFAWGVFALVSGVALDHFGFVSNFAMYLALSVPLFWLTLQLRRPVPDPEQLVRDAQKAEMLHEAEQVGLLPAAQEQAHTQPSGAGSAPATSTSGASTSAVADPAASDAGDASWRTLLSDGAVITLLFQCMVQGLAGPGITQTFLFIFAQDLGGSPTMMSSLLAIDCMVEVAIFSYLTPIMRFVGGPDRLLTVSQCVLVLQLLGYSMSETPLHVGIVEVLQGIAFATGWSAVCAKGKALAPEGLEATMVGLVTAAYFGVGTGAGALLGGQLLGRDLGWTTTWEIAAALVAVSAVSAVAVPSVWTSIESQLQPKHAPSLSAIKLKADSERKER